MFLYNLLFEHGCYSNFLYQHDYYCIFCISVNKKVNYKKIFKCFSNITILNSEFIFTSPKNFVFEEVLFSSACICLCVCLSVCLSLDYLKKFSIDFHETWQDGVWWQNLGSFRRWDQSVGRRAYLAQKNG